MFLRIVWKRPPYLVLSGETPEISLAPLHFIEQDLANVLYRIYIRMFDNEDWLKKFANIRLNPSKALNPQPLYHRAGMAAFLRLVKGRVACDWDKTMNLFYNLILERPNAPMGI